MVTWRALTLVAFATVLVGHLHGAEVARLAVGRGHLASRAGDAEWQGVRLGDELPKSCHLRTSPVGPIRIDVPEGVLCLAGETDVDLDVDTKRIVIEGGAYFKGAMEISRKSPPAREETLLDQALRNVP